MKPTHQLLCTYILSVSIMTENEQLVRSDFSVIDVLTSSKSFIYTWKINNFRHIYKQKEDCIKLYKSDTCENETQLWKIKLYINGHPNTIYSDTYLAIEIVFDTEAVNIPYDYFNLYVFIRDKTEEHKVYESHERVGTVQLRISYLIKKDFLLNEENGLLPDGNLTLKFKLIFTKSELNYNNIHLVNSVSCMYKPKFIEFENMLNNDKFSDAKISVDGKQFHVHKVILASRSPVFAAMFEHNMKESNENTIKITDFDHKIVQEMLRFVYTNQVKDIKVVASDLLVAADKYDIEQLKLLCEESLINDLNVENVTTLLIYAEKYGVKRLKELSLNFFKLHAKEIVKTKSFEEDFNAIVHLIPNIFKTLVFTL